MNILDTKRLLHLTNKLHSLNNKLYQLKITGKVFVVDKDKHLTDISLIESEIESLIKEIKGILEES